MKKVLKITGILVLVLLAALLTAPTLLRGKIAEIVKKEANAMLRAQLDFERLDISLLRHFPNASLELKGLTLTGVDAFEGDTLVTAERISVMVNPFSLFGDEGFDVSKVYLDAPSVYGHKLADGQVNWDIMQPSDQAEEPEDEEPSTFRLAMRDLRITDASIRYDDDSTRMQFAASPASLRLKGDLSAAKSDLALRMTAGGLRFVSGGIPLLSGAEAEVKAVIEADLENNRYTFADNRLRLNAIELALDGWAAVNGDAITMDITAGCDDVKFKELLSLIPAFYTRDFRNLSASGALSMALWVRGTLDGQQLPAFEWKADVTDGSFQYASLPKAVTGINVAASIANPGGTMDQTVVDVPKFGLQFAGNSVAATFHATNLVSDPLFRASATGKVDLGAVKEVYPLDEGIALAGRVTADLKLSGRMSDVEKQRYEQLGASGTFTIENFGATLSGLPEVEIKRAAASITPASMTLGELGVTVGRSDLAATGQLSNYLGWMLRGDELSGRLYVKSNLLDLNEIISYVPEDEEAAETAGAPGEQQDGEAVQALEIPKNLRLTFNAEMQKILFQKMTISDFTGELRAAEGTLSLDRLAMGMFGGKATASGSYSTAANAAEPALKLTANFSGASFQQTFEELDVVQKLVPLFAKTGGNYAMSLDLTTRLDATMSPIMESFDATGEISSANIHIQNIEAFNLLAEALKNDALRNIEAKDVKIRFTVTKGRVTTHPFDLKMGNVTVNMSGSTGIDQSIDYTARVTLPASTTKGVLEHVGVNIGGTFTAPKVTLGVKEAAEEAIKNVIDQQVQRLTGSESLSEELDKQAERLREEARKAGEKLVDAAAKERAKLIDAAASKGALAKLAAEKAGDKLVAEAEKQAEKLMAEAEAQITKLRAAASSGSAAE